ncbi:type 2 lanthipeptide synthetase LanM family protein [Streptococcus caviae]|uniref:type 2 lanthipeptide synthetase LanM family protein n=1 Tax=Streptococcus sp. 'caviae' TaxID=1915004 RepID=UPI00094BC440|nr:type 2 lanthipeptide synthetase LanM family protein [Streptococcus sp. 'caviae']OLN84803.1 serine dehydratase [Streptococcus sp. 'caviae']
MVEQLKKEYLNHQFYNYFVSIIEYKVLPEKFYQFDSQSDSVNQAFKVALWNHTFETVMYLSLKTLVFDINYMSQDKDNQEEAYKDYTAYLSSKEGISDFFSRYPFLLQQLKRELSLVIEDYNIFIKRFITDFEELKNKFEISGVLKTVQFSQGDSHSGKQTVIRLDFHDKTIYYKPKHYESFALLSDILGFLEEHDIPTFQLPAILSKGDYCWQLGVESQDSTLNEVEGIYAQFGTLACIAEVFSITDLHMENIIVSGGNLYLIDLETFFQRKIYKQSGPNNITNQLYQKISGTVLSSGLFPVQYQKTESFNISGICGSGGTVAKGKYELLNKGRGDMRLVKADYFREDCFNIPRINGKAVEPQDYSSYIIDGFRTCYRFFMENKTSIQAILKQYRNLKTRLLYRNTNDYGKFLRAATNPRYLSSEEDRQCLFSFLNEAKDNIDAAIIENEIYDLMNGDIPYFTADTEGKVYNSKENLIEKLADNPSIDEKLEKMDLDNLNFVTQLIQIVIQKPYKHWERLSGEDYHFIKEQVNTNAEGLLLSSAKEILEQAEQKSFSSASEMTWLNIDITESKQWVLSPQDITLYTGLIGNALCYLYAYQVTKDKHYYSVLKKILSTIENTKELFMTDSLSVFTGRGGLLYLYYSLWLVLKDEHYRYLSFKIIADLKDIALENHNLDFLSGLAGLLVVLCHIYEREKAHDSYELLVNISDLIASKAINREGETFWISDLDETEVLNGFSHGISGIAYALLQSWRVTQNHLYYQLAVSAIKFENTRIADGNWIDFRNRERRQQLNIPEPIYWCHGASGIGMTRYREAQMLKNEVLKEDFNMAKKTVLKDGALNADCLCHGKMGNLELLMLEDEVTKDSQNDIAGYLLHIVRYASEHGWISGLPQHIRVFNLMVGELGIAYQLLRFISCYQVPSILLLEFPKGNL